LFIFNSAKIVVFAIFFTKDAISSNIIFKSFVNKDFIFFTELTPISSTITTAEEPAQVIGIGIAHI
jgi:hypothetical protein